MQVLEDSVKKRVRFIINPISGVGQKHKIEGQIAKYLDHNKFDYDIAYTEGPKHAMILSEEAAKEGVDVVVAVGGDGSVHEAGVPLVGTKTALAIIPAGSGNGLARYLKIPLNHIKAIQRINRYRERIIDTIEINDTKFISTAGFGYDAFIAWKFATYGPRGLFSYILLIIQDYFRYKPKQYKIEFDDKVIECTALFVNCANSNQWGNNAVISPEAKIDDGLIDLVIVRRFPFPAVFVMALMLFNNSVDKSVYTEIYRTTKVKVTQQTVLAHVDGEPIRIGREVVMKIVPKSLRMIV